MLSLPAGAKEIIGGSPIRFSERLVERPWGGDGLSRLFGKVLPPGRPIGESWEVSAYPGEATVVACGPLAGISLDQLCAAYPLEILGERLVERGVREFPLLAKLICSGDILSVQVHPDDDYARSRDGMPWGKCEMWYVLDAEPGARIACGFSQDLSPSAFVQAALDGDIGRFLNWVDARQGDVVLLPPGCVHAMGAGVAVYEIQESSDLTYRVYDWGKVGLDGLPRELHLDKAREVTDFSLVSPRRAEALSADSRGAERQFLAACSHYAVERVTLSAMSEEIGCSGSFSILTAVEGSGSVTNPGGHSTHLRSGETLFLPASLGACRIERERTLTFLRTSVPDLLTDVVDPLRRSGHSDLEIARLGGEGRENDLARLLQA